MNIAQLTSDSISELHKKRVQIAKDMIDGEEGTLLVLRPSYAGPDRRHHGVSYAVFTIFFELWDRYRFDVWSYTFDEEGLIFYIHLPDSGTMVKNVMIHYEDYHPLGFAVDSDVYTQDAVITRESLDVKERFDLFTGKRFDQLVDIVVEEPEYHLYFVRKVEAYMVKGDKQSILSNILTYAYITAFTKEYGFGMYGPNFKGSNDQMNFEKFFHLLQIYKKEVKNIFNVASDDFEEIRQFQRQLNQKIQQAVLSQQSFEYTIFMSSITLFAFINSRGYADMAKQVKIFGDNLKDDPRLSAEIDRYNIVFSGFRDIIHYYVPYLQKSRSAISTFLYIMSRYDDETILTLSGQQNLLKVQFLAKSLLHKPEKWEEFDAFCVSNEIYPYDDTTLLVVTAILDIMQRYYVKIKILFDVKGS